MSGPRKPRPTISFNQGTPKPFPQTIPADSLHYLQGLSDKQLSSLIEEKRAERWHSSYNHIPGLSLQLRLAVITVPFIVVMGLAYVLQWLGVI